MSDLYTLSPEHIVLYGVGWCSDCHRARKVFAQSGVKYIDIDVDQDVKGSEFIIKINEGGRSVPTIVFPDGTTLTEPSNAVLAAKLEGYKQTA